jgi:hypothetical protein
MRRARGFGDGFVEGASAQARREADRFYADLIGAPRRRRGGEWAEADPELYLTGEVPARAGWTFVAYLGARQARLAFNVLRSTPSGRIGNVGWVTNNPGSLDLTTPFVTDRSGRRPATLGERLAVRAGAYEKNPADIATYRRFAVFPDLVTGERAVFQMLLLLARSNNNPRVGEVLRIFFGNPDPVLRAAYEASNRARLVVSYERRLSITDPSLSGPARTQRATDLANGLLDRKFLELERFVTDDSQFLERAVLDVESAKDMARVGLLYGCSGFANLDEARRLYAADAGKLREIEAVAASTAVTAQLDRVLGCGGVRA